MKCKCKVTSTDGVVAECTKCGTVMKNSKCKMCRTAKVSVTATSGQTHSSTLFNDVIEKIIDEDSEQPDRDLLLALSMKFYVDANNVVYTVKELY